MLASTALRQLSDSALLDRLKAENQKGRGVLAELLRLLAEVDSRKLYLGQGFASLFSFATGALGLSEDEAGKRVHACRAGRTYPVILELVEKGELHLTAVNMLAPHLTAENHAAVLAAACKKSKRELEVLVASLSPKPDAVTRLWRVPEQPALNLGTGCSAAAPHTAAPSGRDTAPACSSETDTSRANPMTVLAPEVSTALSATPSASTSSASTSSTPTSSASTSSVPTSCGPLAKAPRGTVTPLSPERFRLQVTLSRAGRDALLRAQELCRRENPSRELSVVLEKAICAYVEELERKQFAKCRGPRRPAATSPEAEGDSQSKRNGPRFGLLAPTSEHVPERIDANEAAKPGVQRASAELSRATSETTDQREKHVAKRSRHIPRAIRRAVFERDSFQCTFVGPAGRCSEKAGLEVHHLHPFARDGEHSMEGLAVRCRAHNLHQAVLDFGAEVVAAAVHRRRGSGRPAMAGGSESP